MANKIQIKRGLQAAVDNLVLSPGEMAVALDTGNVYIGITEGIYWINPPAASADTARTLETAREFSITGDVVSNAVSFNGSQNVSLTAALAVIAGLAAGDYTKVAVNNKGQVVAGKSLSASDIPTISKDKVSGLGNAAGLNTGTASGNVVVVGSDGKISPDIMPDLAITDTTVVESEAAMLALSAQRGDVAIRTDISKTFILKATPASKLSNWQEFLVPGCPIQSVNGKTGNVTLTASDVGALPSSTTIPSKTSQLTNDSGFIKSSGAPVQSVNSKTGAVTLAAGDVGAEPALKNSTSKTSVADNDGIVLLDSAASNGTKKLLWSVIKSSLKTYFDTLYNKYTLPTMSASVKGGAKVGTGLVMSGEVLSVGDIDGGTF